jgi:LmbE family N-acetylglucosaminyl deacetylase
VVVFTPHPDDETLAAGGLISRLAGAGVPVHVVFITNGDGYPMAVKADFDLASPTRADYVELGELREREALAALGRLGLGRRHVSFLGFPDGGLGHLWHAHWSPSHPYTSPYTREDSPPYRDTVNPDVGYDGQDLTGVIERLLRDLRPSVVLMPHPHDTHRDHASTSYFVTEAVSALQARGVLSPDLTVLTYLVHYPSWPTTRGPDFDRFLAREDVPDTTWLETELSPDELAAKRAALGEYRSQLEVMNGFLRSFLCRNELLGKLDARLLARIAAIH